MTNRSKKISILIIDALLLGAALFLSLALRRLAWPDTQIFIEHLVFFLPIITGELLVFYIAGLYDFGQINKARAFIYRLGNSIAISTILAVAYFYLFPATDLAPKTMLAFFAVISFLLLLAWRRLSGRLAARYLPKIKVGAIGQARQIDIVRQEIVARPYLGLELAASLDLGTDISGLKETIRQKGISRLIISSKDIEGRPEISSLLLECLPLHLEFVEFSDFYEQITGKVLLEEIDRLWFLDNIKESRRRPFQLAKRTADLIVSILIFALSLPAWPFIALAIKGGSKGPVLFRQKRLGQDGRVFTILKFRSMREEGNDRSMTESGDTRITKVGKFLRDTRLDEIPQLINVIRGEMSLIGPRPERPELVQGLAASIPFYQTRLLIKPGLTGWDQVSGQYHSASLEDTYEKLQFDLFYIKHRSFYLDFTIVLKTIATMMRKMGR